MIDFQERDTTRGVSDDGDDTEQVEDEHGGEGEADGRDEDREVHEQGDEHDHTDHDHHHHDVETLGAAVLTVSSTRTTKDDPAGDAIVAALETEGHEIATREVVRDDYDNVQAAVDAVVGRGDVDAVVTAGGTGVTPDDVTIEAVRPLFEKELPGFGELFRRLSFEEIGTKVVGTRATAGVADGVPVFCLPGSENAARLGAEEIVVAEAGHLAGLATRE